MARKPEKKVVISPEIQQAKFNLSDSFTSLLLGVVVVVAAIILFFSFIRGGKQEVVTSTTLPAEKISQELEKTNKEETVKKTSEESKSLYTVVQGDTLWSISEKFYKSGFEWEKIAKANNITDPSNLKEGTKITISGTDTRILATNTVAEEKLAMPQGETKGGSNAISGDSYKIVRGDDLWDIAVRAYGDGYKWIDIAKTNNLTNPDLIHADNVLKLPR